MDLLSQIQRPILELRVPGHSMRGIAQELRIVPGRSQLLPLPQEDAARVRAWRSWTACLPHSGDRASTSST